MNTLNYAQTGVTYASPVQTDLGNTIYEVSIYLPRYGEYFTAVWYLPADEHLAAVQRGTDSWKRIYLDEYVLELDPYSNGITLYEKIT